MRWVRGEGDRRYMAPDLLREEFDKPADIFRYYYKKKKGF
jgi:hypothetical protein